MTDSAPTLQHSVHADLISLPLPEFVARHVLERIPHLFGDDWVLYRKWRSTLATSLRVDPCEIIFTGSACAGVSLSPGKRLRYFSDDSDIDVAVVSDYHFNDAWHFLRSFSLASRTLSPRERQSIIDHQTRHIYWGCIATDRILRLLPFGKPWTVALAAMRAEEPTVDRTVNIRIYKDFDALRSYQLIGLERLRTELLTNEQ